MRHCHLIRALRCDGITIYPSNQSWNEERGHLRAKAMRGWRGSDREGNAEEQEHGLMMIAYSDILHPNRANISKEELREKLGSLYKAQKDQISVFGLRTQFGGGKTTGFALVYDSPEAMKKFEPNYRLVRVGLSTKPERASRQQRTYIPSSRSPRRCTPTCPRQWRRPAPNQQPANTSSPQYRQAAQEPTKDPPRNGKGQGCQGEEGEIDAKSLYILGLVGQELLRCCAALFSYRVCAGASKPCLA